MATDDANPTNRVAAILAGEGITLEPADLAFLAAQLATLHRLARRVAEATAALPRPASA